MREEPTLLEPHLGGDLTMIDRDPPTLLVSRSSDPALAARESPRFPWLKSFLSRVGARLGSSRFAWALTFSLAITAGVVEHQRRKQPGLHPPLPIPVAAHAPQTDPEEDSGSMPVIRPEAGEDTSRGASAEGRRERARFTKLLLKNDFEGALALLREIDPKLLGAGDHQALLTVLTWKTRCRGPAVYLSADCP
ncbi:MAG: hypothetical protein AAF436_15520 [Myxococcota bacterium]